MYSLTMLRDELLSQVLEKSTSAWRSVSAWSSLDAQMPEVSRCWNKVRSELMDVGLLDDEVYLDHISLVVAVLPSFGKAGYVYEEVGWIQKLVGFEPGTIYLPRTLPREAYVPGGTLTDVIRHEYGHAWHWTDPEFFDRAWFRRAFGSVYEERDRVPYKSWFSRAQHSPKFQKEVLSRSAGRTGETAFKKQLLNEFVSEYAATRPCEDFAETFMMYLRYRKSLSRFSKRTGVYRKIKAVQKAVSVARKELEL